MVFRRTVAWICAALAGVAAGPIVAAPPVAAAPFTVSLRDMPGSYRVAAPGNLAVAVTAKRKADCVRVRRAIRIEMDGLSPGQVRVQRAANGGWESLSVQAIGGGVRASDDRPDSAPLCRGGSTVGHYIVTFLSGAPTGKAKFTAEAATTRGDMLGTDSASRPVRGGAQRTPSPTPTPSSTPSPTPSPTSEPTDSESAVGVLPPPDGPDTSRTSATSGLGIGAVVIGLGLLMVGIGVALLVFLVRRNGRGPEDGGGGNDGHTMLLPTVRR